MVHVKNRMTGAVIARWEGRTLARADLDGQELSGADLRRYTCDSPDWNTATIGLLSISILPISITMAGALTGIGLFLPRARRRLFISAAGSSLRDSTTPLRMAASLLVPSLRHLWLTDLSRNSLREANLEGAELSRCFLPYSNLSGAHLQKAQLAHSVLNNCDLQAADLTGANLSRTYLGCADLRRAVLCGARLSGAYLGGASLEEADLTGIVYDERTRWPDGFTPPGSRVG
jgi:uncharacterized protein YjbI with pentapeptide repeats